MGWCSATTIMDTALQAAEVAIVKMGLIAAQIEEGKRDPDANVMPEIDAILAPFVTKIATHLREGDWDCIEESGYFSRFPQEMLGKDDREYERWLSDQLQYTDDIDQRKELVRKLSALHEKMGE